jgi:hypothetical protein
LVINMQVNMQGYIGRVTEQEALTMEEADAVASSKTADATRPGEVASR